MVGFGLKLDGKTTRSRIPASASLATTTANQPMTWSLWVKKCRPTACDRARSMLDARWRQRIQLRHRPGCRLRADRDGVGRGAHRRGRRGAGRGLAPHRGHGVGSPDRLCRWRGARAGRRVDAGDARGVVAGHGRNAGARARRRAPAADRDATAPATPSRRRMRPPRDRRRSCGARGGCNGTGSTNFAEQIDEFRISRVVRPPGALKLWVHSEGPPADLLSFGTPEQGSVFGNGYLGDHRPLGDPGCLGGDRAILLGVMAVISWVVMASKAIYIGRLTGANRAFRQEFQAAKRRYAPSPRAAAWHRCRRRGQARAAAPIAARAALRNRRARDADAGGRRAAGERRHAVGARRWRRSAPRWMPAWSRKANGSAG